MDWRQNRDITGVRHLLECARAEGLDAGACLVGSGIEAAELAGRNAQVQAWQELAVIRNLLQHGARPGLGFAAGRRYHLTSLGLLGFTMLACRSLLEAFETFGRFQSLALTLCPVSHAVDARGVWLLFDDGVLPPDARAFVVERGMAGCLQLAVELLQRPVAPLALELKAEAPVDLAAYARDWPYPVRFGAARNALLFAHADLDASLPQAHLDARASGEQLCERLCAELSLTLAATPTARAVQQVLMRDSASLLDSREVARRLGLSERTLQRHLAAEGQTFQALGDGIRRRLAERLLLESRLDLNGIAQCLGYAEAASFSRAFVRWNGVSPGRWKRRAGPPAQP
ncbi:AraC family transcriptional regulator [Pseudomonas citronellolis]|uniref:AraC family transcriptional regulator n=1 Tax=Pseudomonas citronellolis TaxID=53408 RepID=UPI0023E35864|nr:AraC family transcriptional regulator [Pseudomonas citronellolis]MDF3931823.1 AraC family transcriptional regulator [Pseudomonas citronellolis]